MSDYIQILVLVFRIIYSLELLFIGITFLAILPHINKTSIYSVIKYITWSFISIGFIRFFTSFYDFYFEQNTGLFTLFFSNIVFGYIIYVFLKLSNTIRKLDLTSFTFDKVIHRMILDIDTTLKKINNKN